MIMKTYKDYVFEAVSHPDFNDKFEEVCDKLDEFWSSLDISFDNLEDFNSKTPQQNTQQTQQKQQKPVNTPPEKMRNGSLIEYNYVTNSGKTVVVTIDTPDNGTNTNTALVKPVYPPNSKKIYPVKWSRLTPLAPQLKTT